MTPHHHSEYAFVTVTLTLPDPQGRYQAWHWKACACGRQWRGVVTETQTTPALSIDALWTHHRREER